MDATVTETRGTEMVDAQGAAALMRSASALVRQALERLDVSERDCDACGSRHFANRAHAKVFEQFQRTPDKLAEAASRIENDATKE